MRGLSSVVFVAVALAVAVADRHQQELKEHYDHLAYIAEFNCHVPQPRVLSVHELFPEEDTAHKAFFPDVTVLHRCDNHVGCCPSNHVCRPKHTHPLNLPFKVTYLEHIGKHKKGSWIIDYHTFENHTECECVDASVCVPPTQEQVVVIGGHKPEATHHEQEHHGESHHEQEHHGESHHQPEHHGESHHEPEHHGESHLEPDHHSESSHKPDHQGESHYEPDHQSSSYKPDSSYVGSSSEPSYNYVSAPSSSPEDGPSPSSPDNNEQQESSTLPLLVNYVLSSSSTTEKTNGGDLGSFFD